MRSLVNMNKSELISEYNRLRASANSNIYRILKSGQYSPAYNALTSKLDLTKSGLVTTIGTKKRSQLIREIKALKSFRSSKSNTLTKIKALHKDISKRIGLDISGLSPKEQELKLKQYWDRYNKFQENYGSKIALKSEIVQIIISKAYDSSRKVSDKSLFKMIDALPPDITSQELVNQDWTSIKASETPFKSKKIRKAPKRK